MIRVKPTINRNSLELKQTPTAPIHSTGNFYMQNEQSITGVVQSCTIVHKGKFETISNYVGHVKITAEASRRIDSSILEIGIATFNITASTAGVASLNKIRSDSNWDSWVNATTGSSGFENYISANLYNSFTFKFNKGDFVSNEVDPGNNDVIFKNSYALNYSFKIEFLNRRPAFISQKNIILDVPNLERQNTNLSTLVLRPEVNTPQGTTLSDTEKYFKLGCDKPGGIFIQNTGGYDYIWNGRFSNETEAIGSSRIRPFSAYDKNVNIYNRHNYVYDRFRSIRPLAISGTLEPGMPMGNCVVDLSDPLNGGNPVLYHQTVFRVGSPALTRQIGYTNLGGPSNESSYGTGMNLSRTYAKYPTITAQGTCAVSITGDTITAPFIIPSIIDDVRVNGRPLIYVRQNSLGILINGGTYAAPSFNKLLTANTNTGLSNNASKKYTHNEASLPAFVKGVTFVNVINGEDGWYYFSIVRSSGNTRGFIRLQYTGPISQTLSEVWNWANWTFEELAGWVNSGTNPINAISTNTTFNFTNFPSSGALVGNVPFGTENGFPVFFGLLNNKLCKFYHNGGASPTLSDNWSIEVVAGSTSTSTLIPVEGIAFSADFCPAAANSWYYRKQVVDGWMYFQSNINNYIGRVCIDSSDPDYLKFETLNIPSLVAADSSSSRF